MHKKFMLQECSKSSKVVKCSNVVKCSKSITSPHLSDTLD